jgi:hypothetical protein
MKNAATETMQVFDPGLKDFIVFALNIPFPLTDGDYRITPAGHGSVFFRMRFHTPNPFGKQARDAPGADGNVLP